MKKIAIVVVVALGAIALVSCNQQCTCSKWVDGKNVDNNPVVYEQEDINKLNARNCAELEDYYSALGLGYDEETQTGIRCE